MKIALDYDGTYTEDPDMWNAFIELAKSGGHEVWIVTMRYDNFKERITGIGKVISTGRKAKKVFCDERGIHFVIWALKHPNF